MFMEERLKRNWLLIVFLAVALNGFTQVTRITGVVKDGVTKQPLYAVSVAIKNRNGVTTDSLGNFKISSDRTIGQLQFSIVGYKSQSVSIKSPDDTLFVFMQPNGSVLNTVVIKDKKQKYRNKDNPAVELIRRVIDNKSKNRLESYQYAQYEKYEKMQISLDNFSEKIKNSKLTKKYHFLFENADTTMIPGKALLPVYLEEKISHEYYRASPQKSKSIVEAHKRVDFGEFVDMRG